MIELMTYDMWKEVKNFTPKRFGTISMAKVLIFTLQDMRDYIGRRIFVHNGYRPGNKGYHPLKMAVDIDIEGLHVIDQYLVAERFDNFNGIGVYPLWRRPGLHLDVRLKRKSAFDSRWGRFEPGNYVKLDYEFFRKIIMEESK